MASFSLPQALPRSRKHTLCKLKGGRKALAPSSGSAQSRQSSGKEGHTTPVLVHVSPHPAIGTAMPHEGARQMQPPTARQYDSQSAQQQTATSAPPAKAVLSRTASGPTAPGRINPK